VMERDLLNNELTFLFLFMLIIEAERGKIEWELGFICQFVLSRSDS
jgi:hypothetical protein